MRSRALRLVALVPLLLPVLLAPTGCHKPIPSICQQTCECKPCTDADLEACVVDMETAVAEVKDCEEQLDAYLACYDETLSCQSGTSVGTSECDAEESALASCSGSGSLVMTVCEKAIEKVSKCTGSKLQEDEVECNPQARCISACTLDTSCDVLLGQVFSESFQVCINDCNGFGGTGGVGGSF